jgi:hypothetical protein
MKIIVGRTSFAYWLTYRMPMLVDQKVIIPGMAFRAFRLHDNAWLSR